MKILQIIPAPPGMVVCGQWRDSKLSSNEAVVALALVEKIGDEDEPQTTTFQVIEPCLVDFDNLISPVSETRFRVSGIYTDGK